MCVSHGPTINMAGDKIVGESENVENNDKPDDNIECQLNSTIYEVFSDIGESLPCPEFQFSVSMIIVDSFFHRVFCICVVVIRRLKLSQILGFIPIGPKIVRNSRFYIISEIGFNKFQGHCLIVSS